QLGGMTATPAAGTYLVMFSTWLTSNSTGATMTVSIYSGGSQKTDSVRTAIAQFNIGFGGSSNVDIPISTQGIVTVNGSQAIQIQWNTSGGTATAHQRTMTLLRLS